MAFQSSGTPFCGLDRKKVRENQKFFCGLFWGSRSEDLNLDQEILVVED